MRVKVKPETSGIVIKPEKKNSRTYTMGTVLLRDVFLSPTGPVGELLEEYSEQWPPGAVAQIMTRLSCGDGKFTTIEKEPVDFTGWSFKAAYIVGADIYVSKD